MVQDERFLAAVPEYVFSNAELAQASAFIYLVQRAEGNLIVAPESILQMRYGLNERRALALTARLEHIGCWVILVDENGRRCAQVLRSY